MAPTTRDGDGACNGDGGAGAFLYPPARRDTGVIEKLGGTEVADPYRWLEDPDSEETREFVRAQNELSQSYISGDVRERVLKHLKRTNEYNKLGCPFRVGEHTTMYFEKQGAQNQSVLYAQKDGESNVSVVLDPNEFSADGTAALGLVEPSNDGRYLAYSVSQRGSDWCVIRVRDLVNEVSCDDEIDWARYTSVAWLGDESGFYYCRYPDTEREQAMGVEQRGTSTARVQHHMVYFHRLGSAQEEDRLVWRRSEQPDWNFGVTTTEDGAWLLISASESCAPQALLWAVDLRRHFGAESDNAVPLVSDFAADYSLVANDGDLLYFQTNRDAPRGRVVGADVRRAEHGRPESDVWTELLPEHPQDVLVSVSAVNGDGLLAVYSHNVQHVLQLRELRGGALRDEVRLPDVGCVRVNARRRDSKFFHRFTSFAHPGTIFVTDLSVGVEPVLYRQEQVPGHCPEDFVTDQRWFDSRDGTSVPMFVTRGHGQTLPAPCALYGYGGFMISLPPSFSLTALAWMKLFGGVYVVANVRGGDEFGEAWHNQGIHDKKQNVFDDFQAAAEELVRAGVTAREKLWILGGSNGGLLVGACLNQRPQLFGAAVAMVGVMDMLRYHKFGIGRFWTSDFGDPDKPEDFEYIYKYSPLHNVREATDGVSYPATLLMTADHDDRVAPLHSLKFAAELQHKLGQSPLQTAPLLLLVDTNVGHGAGKPTSKVLEEAADRLAFVARALNVPLLSD